LSAFVLHRWIGVRLSSRAHFNLLRPPKQNEGWHFLSDIVLHRRIGVRLSSRARFKMLRRTKQNEY
jgi:hypothetical protein